MACQIPASDEIIKDAQAVMKVYKLRHFATILFQLMNESDPQVKEALYKSLHPKTGERLFYPHEQLQHLDGLRLII